MKTIKQIVNNDYIYLYNWNTERLEAKWDKEYFGKNILDNSHYYEYYLNKQNASGDDVTTYHWYDGTKRIFKREYSFCRYVNELEFDILNIKDLKLDWDRKKKVVQSETVDEYDYMNDKNFRNGPLKGCNHYGRIKKTYRTVKHSRMLMNELSRYKEDKPYISSKSKSKLMSYSVMDWDAIYRKNNRSWKDQSKKRKQYDSKIN